MMSQPNADRVPAKDPVSPEVAQLEELKAELHRTNQELRAVYENMGDGVLIAHTETSASFCEPGDVPHAGVHS